MRGHWVRRDRAGRLGLRFEPLEVETLMAVVAELREVLVAPTGDDPISRRLFPRAYLDPTEEASEEQWQALVAPDLLRSRLDALDSVTTMLSDAVPTRRGSLEVELDEGSAATWAAVLNDARLAHGTALEVTEETDLDDFGADDERRGRFLLYIALTSLQGELIDALLDAP